MKSLTVQRLKPANTGGVTSAAFPFEERICAPARRLAIALVILTATNACAAAFTNDIKVMDNIFFAVTDGHGPTNLFEDVQIEATNFLVYVIEERGASNRTLRAFVGPDAVVLDLSESTGKPVPRTAMGRANARVPSKKAKFVRLKFDRIHSPGSLRVRPLGFITEFFEVKAPGTYVLEARLRHWRYTNQTFTWFLTEPVRMPVIVRDPVKQVDPSPKRLD